MSGLCGESLKNKVRSYDVEDYTELYEKFKSRYDFDWEFTTDINSIEGEGYQVVVTECLEHNDPTEFLEEIKKAIGILKPVSMFITTPNVTFNKYYGLKDGEMRHEDHKIEMNESQFRIWCENLPGVKEFVGIGDRVGKDVVTLGCKIVFDGE